MSTKTTPIWLSISQAADKFGVHKNTIRNLIRRGELPASRIGERIIRISESDLQALFTPYVGGEYSTWNK